VSAFPTAVLLCLAGLWPLAAFAGGLAFAPLAGLAALLLIFPAVRDFQFRPYMAGVLLFFQFAAASAVWSPLGTPFAEIDLASLDVHLRSDVARVGLLLPALGVLFAASQKLTSARASFLTDAVTLGLVAHLIIVCLLAAFEEEALALFAPLMPDSGEGVQNISRNSILLAVAAPVLIIGLTRRLSSTRAVGILAAVIMSATGAALAVRGVHAGLLALVLGSAFALVVRFAPVHGFRILGGLLGAVILSAPIVFGALSAGARPEEAATSAQWRLAIWERVVQVIEEQPLRGSGVGVLRTIEERIPAGPFAGEKLVPNHSHNMLLQLWSETGAVGASLLALSILLVAWRLPAPLALGRAGLGLAAVTGGVLATAMVSFDLWREWWWAAAGLLYVWLSASHVAGSEPLVPRAQAPKRARESQEPRGRGRIVFGNRGRG